jgi:hypothetical protein
VSQVAGAVEPTMRRVARDDLDLAVSDVTCSRRRRWVRRVSRGVRLASPEGLKGT